MPSRSDRAVELTLDSLPLAVVPALATFLSFSDVTRALASRGSGVTFSFPTGLPTLWTYVSLPSGVAGGSDIGGPLSLVVFVPAFLLGLLVTSALEAGFLAAIYGRIDGVRLSFAVGVRRFTFRLVGVNLIRAAVVLAAIPFLIVLPLALAVVLVLSYLLYGLPFLVVVSDTDVRTAIESSVEHAKRGGDYASFGVAHLLVGALASTGLTSIARNIGLPGILLGTAIVAVPALFVATYGLLVFRDLGGQSGVQADRTTRQ